MDSEYSLIFDKQFTRKFDKLDNSLKQEALKKIEKLKENPKLGKPLTYFNNLFELHLRMYRLFYIVDDYRIKVLFIGVEHKDECDKYLRQLTKDRITQLLNEYS